MFVLQLRPNQVKKVATLAKKPPVTASLVVYNDLYPPMVGILFEWDEAGFLYSVDTYNSIVIPPEDKIEYYKQKPFELWRFAERNKVVILTMYDFNESINPHKPPFELSEKEEIYDEKNEENNNNLPPQVEGDYYEILEPEPLIVIERWGLGFHEGNVIKYIARWRKKGGLKDLKKAKWYIERLIELEAEKEEENEQNN